MGKIKAAIVGATGYVGQELFRILYSHPEVEVTAVTSVSYTGKKYSDVYKNFNGITDLNCTEGDVEKLSETNDVIFIALPHGIASKSVTTSVLEKCKVIDIGADFRIKDKKVYEKWYGVEHFGEEVLKEAVYGLCEIHGEEVKNARLVANPGCYTTCSILTLYPLVKEGLIDTNSIIIDAKSGVTGAGRKLDIGTSFCECNESIKAYKVASHRHTPEIEQELSLAAGKDIKLIFTPHLTPMNRGILATCYAKLKTETDYKTLEKVYEKYYADKKFIRLLKEGIFPETNHVKGSEYVDIGFAIDERTNSVIAIGAIDNLVKGAAGQAVQNMNLMFGLDESTGLDTAAIFPI
ncbi:MAG: N-acetyl-gamma-glutamyl-phosphate reductase [Candidatus Gastranaerophilales bacterium]|nr:N-acetyl-gamma-glutamyl-phosphate reductase [Candidatus Gastranaerophilales bacterium]